MIFLLQRKKSRKLKRIADLLSGLANSGKKGIAWLIDPDKPFESKDFTWVGDAGLDLILVGGSKVEQKDFESCILEVKSISLKIPVCIFPSSPDQVSPSADGLLFLSLISGTNADHLIGNQIEAAAKIRNLKLEVLPTGYILVNSGEILSVHRASNTLPLIQSDIERVINTALAGKFLGLDFIFLDAGSGARSPVSPDLIKALKNEVNLPLIVGGGIKDSTAVSAAFEAGADLVVIGNAIEKDPGFLAEVLKYKSLVNLSLHIN